MKSPFTTLGVLALLETVSYAGEVQSVWPSLLKNQNFAVTGYADADSLGNETLYIDGTAAAFSGLYDNGFRVRLTGSASWYRFATSQDPKAYARGRSFEVGFLAGYEFFLPRLNISLLAGPVFGEIVNLGATTDQWGGKAVISLSATPTDQTMGSAAVGYSTIANDLQVQTKAGVRWLGDWYFGPEAKFIWRRILPWQTDFSSIVDVQPQTKIATMRLGAHISAFRLGTSFVGVSGGWAHDRDLGSGYYGAISLYQPF